MVECLAGKSVRTRRELLILFSAKNRILMIFLCMERAQLIFLQNTEETEQHIMLIPIISPLESGMIGLWSFEPAAGVRNFPVKMLKVDIMQEIYIQSMPICCDKNYTRMNPYRLSVLSGFVFTSDQVLPEDSVVVRSHISLF